MYKEADSDDMQEFLKANSIKLCPSRLEQVDLPSVFHKEKDNVLEENKVDASMADHLFARDPTHSRNTRDHRLIQL